MYPRFAFALLFSVSAFALGIAAPAFPEEKCGPNAVFQTCGSACVPDCAKPESPKMCTLQCVIGCFCQEGFLKNSKGECVRPHECEVRTQELPEAFVVPQCADNEEFNPCGSACAPTCANPHPSPVCTKNCVIGCFCKQGHLRNSRGLCVPSQQCEAPETSMLFAYPPELTQCKENEVFLPCGSACAPTCANPHPGPICTLQCVIGCFCKPGYLKNEHGVCVPSETCGVPAAEAMPLPPQMCGDNEEFRQCKGCDGTCKNPNPICPRICVPGCACKKGHIRTNDRDARCVLAEQCPKVEPASFQMLPPCSKNEIFRLCKGCDATCKNPNPICSRICKQGCVCQEGFVRSDDNGQCIMAEQCSKVDPIPEQSSFMMLPPVLKCGENEIFRSCGTACPATCANPHPSPVCTRNCVIGCFCKEGYLRNDLGVCVQAANCVAHQPDLRGPVHIPLLESPMQPEGKCASDREIFNPCGTQMDCVASCSTPLPFMIRGVVQIPKKCLKISCAPACACKFPYYRNTKGQCVERNECDHNTTSQ